MKDLITGLAAACAIFIITGDLPELVFIMSLGIVVMMTLLIIQKKKLSNSVMIAATVGLIALAYTICMIFLHIDLRTMLIEPILAELESAFSF